jgi:hypothetical protein
VLVATARTEHALVAGDGRLLRIPEEARQRMLKLVAPAPPR